MCEPHVTLLDHCPSPTCFQHNAAPSLCTTTPQARCSRVCELEVCRERSSSWVYTPRATHPDKMYSVLGSSLKKIWSHVTICKHRVCKTDFLWVEKEREICTILGIQLQRQLGLHPPEAWNLACTSVPAHDATYCACTSVAWHSPYTSGKKGVQSLHSDLEVFFKLKFDSSVAIRTAGINRPFIRIFSNNTFNWKIF